MMMEIFRRKFVRCTPKSATDFHPLGKINLDRKIAAALLLKINRKEILRAFAGVQYGCDPKGTEKIIHSTRLGMEAQPQSSYCLVKYS